MHCFIDGPHYSWGADKKNCSYGFATLRPDGFVGVRAGNGGKSVGRTVAVNATGAQLVVTADTAAAGAVLTVSVIFDGKTTACTALQGANVTDHALSGCELAAMGAVGKSIVLELAMEGPAALYTFGFASGI